MRQFVNFAEETGLEPAQRFKALTRFPSGTDTSFGLLLQKNSWSQLGSNQHLPPSRWALYLRVSWALRIVSAFYSRIIDAVFGCYSALPLSYSSKYRIPCFALRALPLSYIPMKGPIPTFHTARADTVFCRVLGWRESNLAPRPYDGFAFYICCRNP